MSRIVIDTGVLVSALISPEGPTSFILDALDAKQFVLIASPHLLDELSRVLRRDKFRRYVTLAEVDTFVEDLHECADLHDDPTGVPAVSPDPDDDFLIALAREANANALISGDSDLADLELPDLHTLSRATFLRELASPSEEAP